MAYNIDVQVLAGRVVEIKRLGHMRSHVPRIVVVEGNGLRVGGKDGRGLRRTKGD